MPELDRGLLLYPYDRFNRSFDTRSAEDRDAFLGCFHRDAEIRDTYMPDGRAYSGLGGVRQWLGRAEDGFDSVRFEVERVAPAGEGLLVTYELQGRGATSGVPARQTVHHAVRLRDGLVAYVGAFADAASARAELAPA